MKRREVAELVVESPLVSKGSIMGILSALGKADSQVKVWGQMLEFEGDEQHLQAALSAVPNVALKECLD